MDEMNQMSLTKSLNEKIIMKTNDNNNNDNDDRESKNRVLDMFAESLLYVHKLYNKVFGVSQRKVLAHMPHLINKKIITGSFFVRSLNLNNSLISY